MNSEFAEQEKRRFKRLPKEMSVAVSRLEYPMNTANPLATTTKNLSGTGICFTSPTRYETSTLLDLKIELRGWQQHLRNTASIVDASTLTKPLTAIGEVMWSKELSGHTDFEIGVCFKDIYEDDYRAFLRYLDTVTKKSK